MPAKSQAQQRLFGMAYAYKKNPKSMPGVSQEVKDMASDMSKKTLRDFAATKASDLPKKAFAAYMLGLQGKS
jgi:hypothetical protein